MEFKSSRPHNTNVKPTRKYSKQQQFAFRVCTLNWNTVEWHSHQFTVSCHENSILAYLYFSIFGILFNILISDLNDYFKAVSKTAIFFFFYNFSFPKSLDRFSVRHISRSALSDSSEFYQSILFPFLSLSPEFALVMRISNLEMSCDQVLWLISIRNDKVKTSTNQSEYGQDCTFS